MQREKISYYYGEPANSSAPTFTVHNGFNRSILNRNTQRLRGPDNDWEEPTYHENWNFNRKSSKQNGRRRSEMVSNKNKDNRKVNSNGELHAKEYSSKRRGQSDALPETPPVATALGHDSPDVGPSREKWGVPENKIKYMKGKRENRTRTRAIYGIIFLVVLALLIIFGAGLYVILLFWGPFAATSQAVTTAQPYVPVTAGAVMVVVVGVELDATVRLSNRAFIPAYNNDLSPQYQELAQNFTNTMDAVFYNSDLRDVYNGTTVNGFRQGSVVVNFTINLIRAPMAPTQNPAVTDPSTPSSGIGSIEEQIDRVRGQVEVSIKEIIQVAENNGDLTTLGVEATTFSVTDVSVDVEVTTPTETPPTTMAPSTVAPDDEPPVITCPSDVTAETEAGEAFGIVSWNNPTATDNSGEVTVETDFVPGQLPIGSRDITATATDPSGNTAECVFVVTVIDTEAPAAICPEDITRNTDVGQSYATVSWSSPRGTDNSGTISSVSTDSSEGQFEIGSHVITVTVVDPAGLEGQCTFDVVVEDNEAPVVECPATIETTTDNGSPAAIVTWSATAEDNSGSVSSVSSSPSSGDVFAIGTHVVTVTASDGSGNEGQCLFNVEVFDDELPDIACPASITQPTDLGSTTATVTWQVTATDNSGDSPAITSAPPPGDFSLGTATVIATASDSSGNTASCNFTVTVVDEEAPSITCPDNITVAADVGASSAIVTWIGPFALDNSGQVTVQTDVSPGLLPIGIQTITGTAVDGSGNEAQCTFLVNVEDLENPVVTCPSDITAELTINPVTWEATATDNSETIAVLTSSPSSSDLMLGTNNVTVVAEDPSGNKAVCTFIVTLTDSTPPVITCPEDITATLSSGQSTVTVTWVEPTGTDLSGQVTVIASHSPGDYNLGQVNVTATATDSSGNQATCFFLVTVTDDQSPMINNCPPSQSVNTDSGLATAVVSWTPPTASDNSGSVTLSSDYEPGSAFPIGNTRVTYTATDSSGNSVMTCTFDIAVHDNEKPSISGCPLGVSVNTDSGLATGIANWTEPTASDNSGIQTLTPDYSPGDPFPIGLTTVTYTATDDSGNSQTCTFNVIVLDNERPVITGCPSSLTVNTDNGLASWMANWTEPTASDNSGVQTLVSDYYPGYPMPIGSTTVTYTSTDVTGNSVTCMFVVTVIDDERPVISGCPSPITVNTDSTLATGTASWTEPTALDNSGFQTLTSDYKPGDPFPIGSTTLTYTSIDGSGNNDTCRFDVTVIDNERPVISGCPSSLTVNTDSNSATGTASWTEPTPSDNSGSQTLTPDYNPGDSFPIGSTTVTYTSIDGSGNSNTCSFNVTVIDNEQPVISGCPSSVTVNADSGKSAGTAMWTEPTASDNSGSQTLISDYNSGDSFPVGNTNVTYTSTDDAGNIDICRFEVTVIGNASVTIDGSLVIAGTFTADLTDPSTTLYQRTAGDLVNGFDTIFKPLGSQYIGTTVNGFRNGSIEAGYSVNLEGLIESNGTDPLIATTRMINDSINNGINNGAFGDLPVVPGSSSVQQDTEPPVIYNCPSSLTIATDSGESSGTATWTEPTASDNSGPPTVTSDYNPGDSFPIGSTAVTYTFTDGSGNIASCSFNVTVTDDENPVITGCPSDQSVNTDPGNATAVVTWTPPNATDISGSQTLTSTHNPGDYFPVGNNTVAYTSIDAAGNTDTCTFYLVVTDNEDPVITGCPSDLSINTDPGNATAVVTWTLPTATDNAGTQTLTSTNSPGDSFPIGNNTVTYTSTDAAGNTDTCTFYVVVTDGENPEITGCPSDQSFNTDPGNATAVVTWTPPTATDNSGSQTLTSTHNPGDYFPFGNNTVTYTSTDAAGNTATCIFYIIITDAEAPSFSSCPSDRTRNTATDRDFRRISWTEPTVTDNVDAPMDITVTQTHNRNDRFYVGTSTVVYEATDSSGNKANCSFQVMIYDDQAPGVEGCPSNINTPTDSGQSYANVSWIEPVFTDNVDIVNVTSTHSPLDLFNIGVTEVVYNGFDDAGSYATCSFNVTVYDNENPVITRCPSDQSINTDPGNATAVVTWTPPSATDNSGSQTLTSTNNPGDNFPIGNNTVTYTAKDVAGNIDTCTFYLVVIDNENPVISGCPSDQSVNTDPGNATAVVTWTAPTATDNSGMVTLTSTHNPGDYFPIGNNTVTYTSTDAAGNTDTCTFHVVVTDGESPVITGCPSDQSVNTDPGNATAVVTWTPPSATDNSGMVTLISTHNPGDYFPIGNTTVTYTSTDAAGNTGICTFYVVVTDGESPVISGCPSDQSVNTDPGNATAVVTWTPPTATDNSGMVTLTSSDNPGDTFPIGNNTVTYTSTDGVGDTETCSFYVVVIDSESPVISGCPSDQNVNTDPGNATAVVTWTPPTATDNSGTQTLTSTNNPGDYFPIGNNTVTYTSTDDAGNTDTCTFYVVVIDAEAPSFSSCPSDRTRNTYTDRDFRRINWAVPTATDNVDAPMNITITQTHTPGDRFYVGVTTVVYEATDLSGNTANCSFQITIYDDQAPDVTDCPSNINTTTDSGQSYANVSWTEPVFTDNVAIVNVTSTHSSSDLFSIGITEVVYTGLDEAGNIATCLFNVTVYDLEAPVFRDCPSDVTRNTGVGRDYRRVSWTEPTVTDNVDTLADLSVTQTHTSNQQFYVGVTTVVFEATDLSGNVGNCSFIITIYDVHAPTVTDCPSNVNVTTDTGQSYATVNWTEPVFTDNVDIANVTSTHSPLDLFSIGVTEVSYNGSDDAGNIATCSFTVTVYDGEAPIFRHCPSDRVRDAPADSNYYNVRWPVPTPEDNVDALEDLVVSETHSRNDRFYIGVTTVAYEATDLSGNTGYCSFLITIRDVTEPQLSCPTSLYFEASAETSVAMVTWNITASDNSGVDPTITASMAPGNYTVGSYAVVVTATDGSGNSADCTITIEVIGACGLYYFSCDLSVCLPNEWLCDGVPDCPDQSDEMGCVNPPAVVNPASCGLTPAITPRIVGGTDALPGSWPWIASLSIRVATIPFYHICSASLISSQWAITAAHCILPDALGLIADRIVLGDNELYSSTATEQSADIESIYIHPGFNDFALDFDVALLKLARPVEIDDYVSPICLETTSEEVNVYSQCVTVGWGRTDASGGLSQSLQEANFNLTEIEECRNITLDPSITDNQICAWDPSGGVSICGGDSGGSLVCQEYSGAWRLVGITSASYGCADADNPSVNNLPDIYSRVSRYWDWINSVIEGTPKYTCEPVTIPTCAAVLPYNTTYATSQSPSYEFFTAVLELVQDRTCHPNLDTLVCASILRECRPDDPGRVPCKEMCEEVRTACNAELQVFGAYLDLVLPCDSYPTGPSNDTLLCEYGVDYACGNTDLTVTRGVPVVLSNPSFPSYGVDELSCTWYAAVSNPGDVLIIKFRVLSMDTVVGTLLIGEGSNSANLTSVIAEVRASGTAIETGLGRIWLTYASYLSSRGFELELWAVESGSADFCNDGSDAVVCSSGLSCVPADWVCDGVTDCESGEDEASCTVPLGCNNGYVSCQSVAACIPSAWLCDAINDCQDSSDEMDCDEPIDCGGNFTCASETECVLLSDVCDFFPDCTDLSDEADCQYITFEEVYLSANESYELYSPAFPSSYPTDLNYTWHIQVPEPYVIGIDFVAFDTESGVDILELWEDERSNKTSRRILRWSGSMIPNDIKTNSSNLWAYFHSSQFLSASGFAASVYPTDPGPGSTTVVPTTGPVVDISLTVNEIYTLTSPGYPSNYDISLNLLWTVLAPPSYRVLISPTNFSTEVFYDFLSVGEGLTLDLDTLVVQFSGTYDVPEILMPGREAWIWFFSDGSITSSGFRLEITTSNTADGECGTSYISCYTTDVCISDSATCDENPACINGDDEINCDPSCPDSSILAINSSLPYPVMSDNYPFGYANDIQCLWLLQAPPSHSLVIDIEDFTLETNYDFLYIGLGHDRVDEGALVLQLTGTIAPTRYYLGNQSYLYFVTDYSVSSPGFSLNVTSIPFELTESCDADQRVPVGSSCDGVANCFDNSDEIGCVCSEDQYQCSNGFCMPLSVLCDGVMDCGDFSDEEDCPRCEPIQQSTCLSVLPYNETYYPSTGGDNQTFALESYNRLTAATMCHSDAHLFLCASLFPECIHDGPTARPCRSTCEAVQSACSTSFENLSGYPWPFACEELSNESPIGDGSLCRGPEGDITNTMICGTRPVFNEGGDRIVGGEDSVLGEWPWIGSLRQSGTNHQCGATLINEEWAITAAHCVGLFDTITVGDINILTGTPYHHTSSLDIYSHPNFTSVGGGDDIALVRLLDPILDFSDYVRPICLATVGDEINNYKTCYIAGWGATAQGGSGSTDLQQAVVGLIPDEDCASAYTSFRADSMICAGYLAGEVDTCQGDSGGPLMCEGTDGRWHLVGITSFGNGCARPNYPGVYTRVSPFIDFIMSTIENGF